MGGERVRRSDEDELCALHLRNLLDGPLGDARAVRQMILASGEAMRFGDPERPHFNRHDLELALDFDRYDCAIQVAVENGHPIAGRA
jgi:2-phosphosulfolactate phosphatase